MTDEAADMTDRRKKALERYHSVFGWYDRTRNLSRLGFYVFQTLVILLSGVTPILILATNLKLLQAIPPALASILAGLAGVYQFNEHWMQRSSTAEALKSELVKFETRTGKDYSDALSEAEVIQNFVLRIEAIQTDAVAQWRRSREVSLAAAKASDQSGEVRGVPSEAVHPEAGDRRA